MLARGPDSGQPRRRSPARDSAEHEELLDREIAELRQQLDAMRAENAALRARLEMLRHPQPPKEPS